MATTRSGGVKFTWTGPGSPAAMRRGMKVLDAAMIAAADIGWRLVSESTLADSQSEVHIETGNLLSTGRTFLQHPTFGVIAGGVIYGGIMGKGNPRKFVDYALFEEDRHPYLAPAAQRALPRYREVMGEAFQGAARRSFH